MDPLWRDPSSLNMLRTTSLVTLSYTIVPANIYEHIFMFSIIPHILHI